MIIILVMSVLEARHSIMTLVSGAGKKNGKLVQSKFLENSSIQLDNLRLSNLFSLNIYIIFIAVKMRKQEILD